MLNKLDKKAFFKGNLIGLLFLAFFLPAQISSQSHYDGVIKFELNENQSELSLSWEDLRDLDPKDDEDSDSFECSKVGHAEVAIKAGNNKDDLFDGDHVCYNFDYNENGFTVSENWNGEDDQFKKDNGCKDISYIELKWSCSVEPSPTPTTEPSPTPTPTRIPSPTPTDIPSPTPSDKPSPTPTDEPTPSPKKVLICHIPPGNEGNPQIIEVSENAWTDAGHKPHNTHDMDFLVHSRDADCPAVTPTPTKEPSPTPTEQPSPTPTESPTPTPTEEPSPTPTEQPSPTPTESPTPTPTIPEFPSCEDYLDLEGDWTHRDDGFHHIPGQEEAVEGEDDVFLLDNDSGNFLQCLCPTDSDEGIQTNWWNIGDLVISNEQLTELLGIGWISEFGGDWNLYHDDYLAYNTEYDCSQPTPTPTREPSPTPTDEPSPTPTEEPSPTPTEKPSPTPTETPEPTSTPRPTATPTSELGPEIKCYDLEVNRVDSTFPMLVKFRAHTDDPTGDIMEFRFSFDDTSDGQPREWTTKNDTAEHIYNEPGKYITTVVFKASNGQWYGGDDCMEIIELEEGGDTLGVTTLADTGNSIDQDLIALGMILIAISVGSYFKDSSQSRV